MLNIGVMGLGYIAQQAYLPVYAANRQVVNWHLMTRNEEKLANIQQQYRFASATTSKEQLLAQDLDAVMIHTPTSTHTALIREFLEAGVHVLSINQSVKIIQRSKRYTNWPRIKIVC
nr:Gfo/Idh/MocA family oxidoreductase [Lacticaseibacillus saniviri]